MNILVTLAIGGVATGAILGLLAAGMVITFRTSGLVNIAYGALASVGAYAFYWLHVDHNLNWVLSFFVAVFVVGPVVGWLVEPIAQRVARQPTVWKIVGAVGLILTVQGLATGMYGTDVIPVRAYFPRADNSFALDHARISYGELTVVIISLVCLAGLAVLFRYGRLGTIMAAGAENSELLALAALDPKRARQAAWFTTSTLAALSGVLILPFVGLGPTLLTFLAFQALGAAALGTFTSVTRAYLGGILVGILAAIATHYATDHPALAGLPAAVPYLVLIVALLATPKSKLLALARKEVHMRPEWHGPTWSRALVSALLFVLLLLVPSFVGLKLSFWTTAVSEILLFSALGLLMRTSGIVALCTSTFAAIGAVSFSQLTVDHGMDWVLALLVAGLIAVPVGALVSVAAVRLSGQFLAVATFGFALAVQSLFFGRGFMFGNAPGGRDIPRPSFARSDTSYFYFVLVLALAGTVLVVAVNRSRLGRFLRGLNGSPRALSALGLHATAARVVIFSMAAFVAAVAGVLYGGAVHDAEGTDLYFQPITGLVVVATISFVMTRDPWYAPIAASVAVFPGYFASSNTTAFGLFALWVAVGAGLYPSPARVTAWSQRMSEKLPASWQSVLMKWALRGEPSPATITATSPLAGAAYEHPAHRRGVALQTSSLTVRVRGADVLRDVNLTAKFGELTGIVGPHAAGKTALIDACAGALRSTRGVVELGGEPVEGWRAKNRVRARRGRTFQEPHLAESLTVADNVALGHEARQPGRAPHTLFAARRREHRGRDAATSFALEACGLAPVANRQAGTLSIGQRRLTELARCLAGDFDVLLLDEPTAGLNGPESDRIYRLLARVAAERSCAILVAAHEPSLLEGRCTTVFVLSAGTVVAQGTPQDVASGTVGALRDRGDR